MRILIGTQHLFAPSYREAGMHRFAKTLAGMGHHVDFFSFGQSAMKQVTKPATRRYVRDARAAAASGTNPPNLYAYVNREWVHPASGSAMIERLTAPAQLIYGRRPDRTLATAADSADVVILEAGYPLYWFEAIQRRNPYAKYIAFYNDRLDLVGFRPELRTLIDRLLPAFDLVRTNAERLLDYLPAGAKGRYIPQGVDKARIRFDSASPYTSGSRAIVSVGNMLFDALAVRAIARTAGERVEVHVIGAEMADPPANVIVHGELPFERTLPYIVHADVGLAPYRPEEGADYLVQSSLKIQQYSYCGLPILLAKGLGISAANFVHYDMAERGGVANAVARALAMPKSRGYGDQLLDWPEVGALLVATIKALPKHARS